MESCIIERSGRGQGPRKMEEVWIQEGLEVEVRFDA